MQPHADMPTLAHSMHIEGVESAQCAVWLQAHVNALDVLEGTSSDHSANHHVLTRTMDRSDEWHT